MDLSMAEAQIDFSKMDKWQYIVRGSQIAFVNVGYDSDAENPMDQYANGTIHSFSSNHANFIGYDKDDEVRALVTNSDNVVLQYSEHGSCRWSVQGDDVPGEDFNWDGVRFGGIWVSDEEVLANVNVTDPSLKREAIVKYAQGVCEVFTDWCNGECFEYRIEVYPLVKYNDDAPITSRSYYQDSPVEPDEDACGNFVGYDGFEDSANEALTELLGEK
jgi:hypothetical protein